jgi:dTDP-glucose pyrophosphorylase
MKKIHLVMPMGGSGSRFALHGFNEPKPLLKINGKPFFFWSAQSITKFLPVESLTFVTLREHIEKFSIDSVIEKYYPEAKIRILPEVTKGAVITCLEGIVDIFDESPIVFNDCDHAFISSEFYNFCLTGDLTKLDGALLCFKSNDPKFSFLQLDNSGKVVRTVEKIAVSNLAICGAYYFKNRFIFREAANRYLQDCTYKEFFMSGVYNVMAKDGAFVKSFNVDMHVPFGTPEEYYVAQKSNIFGRLEI